MTVVPDAEFTSLRLAHADLQRRLDEAVAQRGASAEVMRLIATSPGDADQSLRRIAEITERLFGASSVTLLIADGERWGRTIRVGAGSERIAAAVPLAHLAITTQFMPGAVYLENRQIHVPDIDEPIAAARWPGLPLRERPAPAPCPALRFDEREAQSVRSLYTATASHPSLRTSLRCCKALLTRQRLRPKTRG